MLPAVVWRTLRWTLIGVFAFLLPLAATAMTTSGHGVVPIGDSWGPTPGGWVSGAVDHELTLPVEAGGAADAVLHDDLLYITSYDSFSILDVSDPLLPEPLATVPLGPSLWNERPQTNGEILLVSRDVQYLPPTEQARGGGVLEIWDVSDPRLPTPLATYESELVGDFDTHRDHIWTCVLDCAYAYGAGGTILDLREPANPTKVADWRHVAPVEATHHVAEVDPGIVLTGSVPMHVLDATDPASPTRLVTTDPQVWALPPIAVGPRVRNTTALVARADWPDAVNGRLSVVTLETPFLGNCTADAGDVRTYVTTGWRGTGTFDLADTYQIVGNGTYRDGAPPANAFGCSAYGLDVHPNFGQAGGPAAVTFFEHGLRVLHVDATGHITEVGGFIPTAGNSSTPVWITDEILYVIDIHRGIDILSFDGS